jgi:hypothetical protein
MAHTPPSRVGPRAAGLTLGVSGRAYARICYEAFARRKLSRNSKFPGTKEVGPDQQISGIRPDDRVVTS